MIKYFCTNDQAFFCKTCFKKGIGLYQSLYPARATKQNIVGNTLSVYNAQLMFYPACQRWQRIRLYGFFYYITKIVRNNNLVNRFRINAAVFYRFASRQAWQDQKRSYHRSHTGGC